jgi:hypothetical protein
MFELLKNGSFGEPSLGADGFTKISVSQPTAENPLCSMKAVTEVDASPEEIIKFLFVPENWLQHKLDPGCIKASILEEKKFDNGDAVTIRWGEWAVGWVRSRVCFLPFRHVFPQPLWNREFVWASYLSHDKEGNWFIVSQSVQTHPKAPLRESEVVRGLVIVSHVSSRFIST